MRRSRLHEARPAQAAQRPSLLRPQLQAAGISGAAICPAPLPLLEQSCKADRERLKALESTKARALAENFHSGMKTMMRYAFTAQEKEAMQGIDRRERAALRSAASIEDLGRIKQEHEAERAPLIEEASKRPPRGPSASALRAAAIMEAEKNAARAARRQQRRQKPKLRKSPLETGTVPVSGGEERRGRGPTIVVGRP